MTKSTNLFRNSITWMANLLQGATITAEKDTNVPTLSFPCGVGRGATIVRLDVSEGIADVVNVFESFDIEAADPVNQTAAEIIAGSLAVVDGEKEGERFVSFKFSNAKHARAALVPIADWPAFVRTMQSIGDDLPEYLAALEVAPDSDDKPADPPADPAAVPPTDLSTV